jgi:hypothetical protein
MRTLTADPEVGVQCLSRRTRTIERSRRGRVIADRQ